MKEATTSNSDILEYQNRCLFTLVNEQKSEILSSKNQLENLKNQNSILSKTFMDVNCKLGVIADSLNILMGEMCIDKDTNDERIINSIGMQILMKLKENNFEISDLSDQHSSVIENIKNNIEAIIMKLYNGISNVDANMVNSDIKEKYVKLESELKLKNAELENIKFVKYQYDTDISNKNKEIEELKNKVFQFNRRNSCNPLVPYINFSKEHFKQNNFEHLCTCHVCGQDFNEMKEKILGSFPSNEFSNMTNQIISNSINDESINVS